MFGSGLLREKVRGISLLTPSPPDPLSPKGARGRKKEKDHAARGRDLRDQGPEVVSNNGVLEVVSRNAMVEVVSRNAMVEVVSRNALMAGSCNAALSVGPCYSRSLALQVYFQLTLGSSEHLAGLDLGVCGRLIPDARGTGSRRAQNLGAG